MSEKCYWEKVEEKEEGCDLDLLYYKASCHGSIQPIVLEHLFSGFTFCPYCGKLITCEKKKTKRPMSRIEVMQLVDKGAWFHPKFYENKNTFDKCIRVTETQIILGGNTGAFEDMLYTLDYGKTWHELEVEEGGEE